MSWGRLLLAVVVVALAVVLVKTVRRTTAEASTSSGAWFAPYVDLTLTPPFEFETLDTEVIDDLMLAFVVADPDDPCVPTWGGFYDVDEASTALDLDRRLERFRAAGGQVALSFGGALNSELATVCTDADDLQAAYATMIDHYQVNTVDMDIEGAALTDTDASERRAEALAALQQAATEDDRSLAVWLTLPVTPAGLPAEAVAVVDATLAAGVDLAGVNLMTMNFGPQSAGTNLDMVATTETAVAAVNRQLRSAYERAGITLSGDQIWGKIGITPMAGENDDVGNVVDVDAAKALHDWALERGLPRVSLWSINRDQPCGEKRSERMSPLCSSVEQQPLEFSSLFADLPGDMTDAAAAVTVEREAATDDPTTSPYPIWNESKGYQAGKKVVWHREVYEAKWWTSGQQPDAPVVNEWETPWRYVGPVLDGELPPTTTTLPKGTYPEWDPKKIYDEGDMVLLKGVPYRAKWWNQGSPPNMEVMTEFDTPWEQLGLPPGW
ncbi:MAG: chitinase [Acidimicrobiales bacterium]